MGQQMIHRQRDRCDDEGHNQQQRVLLIEQPITDTDTDRKTTLPA